MNLNKLIKDTLEPLGYPVSVATYNNSEDTYIVFSEYNQSPWISADDDELFTKHFIQVDVFSSGNYTTLVKNTKKAMKEAGFGRMFESETFDSEMNKYRKIIRFSFISTPE